MMRVSVWAIVLALILVESMSIGMQQSAQTQQMIRLTLFILSVIGCGLFIGMAYRRPDRRWLFVAPVSWMVNLGAFYACRLAGLPSNVYTINMWSQVIHFHALILLIGGLLLYERT